MDRTIQFKRGLEKNLPTLKPGELAFTTDTKKVFIGSETGNVDITSNIDTTKFASKETTDELATQLTQKARQSDLDANKLQIENALQTLNSTVKKNEMGVLNLNVFDEETRSILQGQTPGQINAVLGEGNVKPRNISGYVTGKNMIDINANSLGKYINPSTLTVTNSASYDTTEFIAVTVGETYTVTAGRTIGHFDSTKTLISAADYPVTFTATQPFVRISISKADVGKAQLEKGNVKTAYEAFKATLPPEILTDNSIPTTKYKNSSITEEKLSLDFLNKTSARASNQNRLLESNIKCFERYTDGDISSDDYKLAKGLSAIQHLEIIGVDPSTPVKLWILSRNRANGWGYRFIFGKKADGVWSTLIDSLAGYTVNENTTGATAINFTANGITVNMRIQYKLIPETSWISDGTAITNEPSFIVSPKNIKLTANQGSGGEAYDQSLNKSDSVNFASVTSRSVSTDALNVAGTIPTGTLTTPPSGLLSGDVWADTTDSATHPILRIKL